MVVFCTINRSQINEIKQLVTGLNAEAFMVIGNAHQAIGSGFPPMKKVKKKRKNQLVEC
jgi:uncharacterized membrane-anchored protein YitT (DUF2179 family)